MRIHERSAGCVRVLDLEGPLTYEDGVSVLHACVAGLMTQGHRDLVMNLARVPYIDSAGLGEIVHVHASMSRRGGTLKLLNVPKRLRDLLVVTRLLPLFDSFDDEASAIASFSPIVHLRA